MPAFDEEGFQLVPEDGPKRLKIAQLAKREDFADAIAMLDAYTSESMMPALCEAGCQVEPDGKCPHGHPSPLRLLGFV